MTRHRVQMLIENYRKLQHLCIEFEVLTAVVMNDVLEEDGVDTFL
jgi:hypothetical protein